ncbi:BhlA/UviB family holin-like peptide, partial [uncultured Aminobacterium sp.]|uniref:BhlA/UviB family holin-like peptide n=1 Tax=uncultured Aminobacterium sp. TaxID=548265 RepID=UPI000E8904F3
QEVIKLAMTQGLWAVLFVALLFYVLRNNEKREERLLGCLEQMGEQYENLSADVKEAKDGIKEVREDVKDLKRRERG